MSDKPTMTDDEFLASIPPKPSPCVRCGREFSGDPNDPGGWTFGGVIERDENGVERPGGNFCAECMK